MSYTVYNIPSGDTLYHLFDTFAGSTGASITMSGFDVSDIKIYKNGSTTQRSSTNGYTLLDTDGINFDGITGIHGFSIDLNDNSDANFYSQGSLYHIVLDAVSVDSQNVSFVACAFRLGPAENTAGTPVVDISASSEDSLISGVFTTSMSGIEQTAAEHSLATVVLATTESEISGTTWYIYETDGATIYVQKTLTTNPSADPITKVQ